VGLVRIESIRHARETEVEAEATLLAHRPVLVDVEPLLPREEYRRQRAARAAADDGDAGALAAASRGRDDESEEPRGAAHHLLMLEVGFLHSFTSGLGADSWLANAE